MATNTQPPEGQLARFRDEYRYVASFENAKGERQYCGFEHEIDALRWINFNKDYMVRGSDRVEKASR
jgi:hypothetical protein